MKQSRQPTLHTHHVQLDCYALPDYHARALGMRSSARQREALSTLLEGLPGCGAELYLKS